MKHRIAAVRASLPEVPKESRMKSALIITSAAALALASGANAQSAAASAADRATEHATAASPVTEGEVRKVDREQGKVTLKHGPIANLNMPGMTMVFKVADPKVLDTLKEGDKVKFTAEKVNGAMTVTVIQPAQ